MPRLIKSIALMSLMLCAIVPLAQESTHVNVATIAPRPADVASIDGVIQAFYEVISGPAGQPRQWSRDRSLYIPDVRFVSVEKRRDGTIEARPITHQQFVDASDASLVKNGFYESEVHRETQQFGQIAHVFSTYESRIKKDGPVIARGINSLELFNDGKRWWVLSVQWDEERPGNNIPKQYLPGK
jgi:hypothetical protein